MSYYGERTFNSRPSQGFRPRAAAAPARTFNPSTTAAASEASLRYLDNLILQRNPAATGADTLATIAARVTGQAITAAQASRAIDSLKAAPFWQRNTPTAAPAALAAEGFYILDNEVYKVRTSDTDPDRRYATKLVITTGEKGKFIYAPGAIRNLNTENRLSLEDAKSIGHQYGICCCCGRHLTDANSVANGIGPDCAANLGRQNG